MIEKSDIIKAWKILREKDNTIPDETLDFMKDVSLRVLENIKRLYNELKDLENYKKDEILNS